MPYIYIYVIVDDVSLCIHIVNCLTGSAYENGCMVDGTYAV